MRLVPEMTMKNIPWSVDPGKYVGIAMAGEKADVKLGIGKNVDSCAIVSGGLDSTTLVYDMLQYGFKPHLLSFNYGQRHAKEIVFAGLTARQLGLPHDIIDLTGLTHLISNSALTAGRTPTDRDAYNRTTGEMIHLGDHEIEVPEGHYAEESMKATVVPNRNMIMLSIAAGVAVNYKYQMIGIGVHAGDHFVYPDCRPDFIASADQTIVFGNEGFHNFQTVDTAYTAYHTAIYSPFIHKTKAEIAFRALELHVPLHMTWSCYKGEDKHCGRCGTCVERLEAIDEALMHWNNLPDGEKAYPLLEDQTEYADTEYWKTQVKNAR
jgi:7-cyano-7-deazaguanine synthase